MNRQAINRGISTTLHILQVVFLVIGLFNEPEDIPFIIPMLILVILLLIFDIREYYAR